MTDFKFTPEQEAWLQKLESVEMQYKQGRGRLINSLGEMCCLGVFCSLQSDCNLCLITQCVSHGDKIMGGVLDNKLTKRLGLFSSIGGFKKSVVIHGVNYSSLVSLNDNKKWSFKQIASYIRSNPENVFVKGAE